MRATLLPSLAVDGLGDDRKKDPPLSPPDRPREAEAVRIRSGVFYPEELGAMTRLLEKAARKLGVARGCPEFEELASRLVGLKKLPINDQELMRLLIAGRGDKGSGAV